jgi:small-conductance mechanosensitive channel
MEPALANTISIVITYTIITLGVLVALSSIGINLSTLTVVLGGLSVGLAFGLQEIVNNFVSGFILLFERSIEIGDIVEVDQNVGIVQRIGVRSTTIKTRDNVELIIPNSYFLTQVVTNMTRSEDLVRTRVSVGVSYNARPREVEQALLEAAAQHPQVLSDPPPSIQFKDFGDSSLDFELFVWTNQAFQTPKLTSELRYNIWDALAARNIEIPFPQRDIHIRSGGL